MKFNEASIYWIHLLEHSNYETDGYVGVSQNPVKRLHGHKLLMAQGKHKNPHLIYAAQKYGWDNLIMDVILTGEEAYCYEIEETFRPKKGIGWNIAPGGHRGPGWTKGQKRSPEALARSAIKRELTRKKTKELQIEARRIRLENKRIRKEAELALVMENRENKKSARKKLLAEREEKRKIREEKQKVSLTEREEKRKIREELGTMPRIKDKAPKESRPICPCCNKNLCAINHKQGGVYHYRTRCSNCSRAEKKLTPRRPKWTQSRYKKKAVCDLCGFHSVYPTQLTVWHVDGNLENIDLTNLRTICLCCIEVVKHRHVTWRRGDLIVDR